MRPNMEVVKPKSWRGLKRQLPRHMFSIFETSFSAIHDIGREDISSVLIRKVDNNGGIDHWMRDPYRTRCPPWHE